MLDEGEALIRRECPETGCVLSESRTILDGFPWVPPEQRPSRFSGFMAPCKPKIRRPALWLNLAFPERSM